jgi:hypothetical protein
VDASSADASGRAPAPLPDPCPGGPDIPPTLECTGLYADLKTKQIAKAARPYAPAVPLWSDGAIKNRWVYLPPSTKIDATSPSEWSFPIGTRFWKEFSVGGKRIETRLFKKVRRTFWVYATYAWNADESAAPKSTGGDIVLGDGSSYHVPTDEECDKCHRGRTERILGFEQGLLSLPDAPGLTLTDLVAEGLISPTPARQASSIGDDGTGLAAPALGWLHVNCGVTCHNDNANSTGYAAGMNLRLDPLLLDGRSSASFDSIGTTVGVRAKTPSWNGAVRIVPSDPSGSLLVQLISHRGEGMQMPPFATRVVDDVDVAKVVAWVNAMPALVVDSGIEAPVVEVSMVDSSTGPHAGQDDATADALVESSSDDAGGVPDIVQDVSATLPASDGSNLAGDVEPEGSVADAELIDSTTDSLSDESEPGDSGSAEDAGSIDSGE